MNKLKLHWPGCKLIGMQIFLRPAVSPPFETRPPLLFLRLLCFALADLFLLRRTVLSFERFYSIPPYGRRSQQLQLRLLRLVDIGILLIRRVAWLMLDYVYGYHSYPWMERERVEFKSQIRVFAIFRMTFLSSYHRQNRYSGELPFTKTIDLSFFQQVSISIKVLLWRNTHFDS